MSRISDYKHHWSDVLAGATLGVVNAVLVVSVGLFNPSSPRLFCARGVESPAWYPSEMIAKSVVVYLQTHCVANLFAKEKSEHPVEKHQPTDYETEIGMQVNNGTANHNCWPNELALRLLTATRPWLSSSCLWKAKVRSSVTDMRSRVGMSTRCSSQPGPLATKS